MKLAATWITLIIGTCTLLAEENPMRFEKYGFAVQTPKGWHLADPKITTYMDGYYVTFTISYNDKKDADYLTMRAMVESFTTQKKDAQPKPEGNGKPAP